MSPTWAWCLKVGAVVALVDLLCLALSQGQPAESDLALALLNFDYIANLALFAYAGYRVGRATGRTTAGAEAGVIACLPPALVAAGIRLFLPQLVGVESGASPGLAEDMIRIFALNVALAGVTACLSGWVGSRGRTRVS